MVTMIPTPTSVIRVLAIALLCGCGCTVRQDSALTGELGELVDFVGVYTFMDEFSITVEDDRLCGGLPTNIPTLVYGQVDVASLWNGKTPTEAQVDIAVWRAGIRVADGAQLPCYASVAEAVAAAEARCQAKQ